MPFTYWDLGNKCPPLWSGNNPATWQDRNGRTVRWQDGAIYTAAGSGWGAAGEDNPDWWLSGIDFRLSGDQVEARAEVPGLEVTKYILDDEGNQIALDPETYDDNPLETIVHVYEKASPNYESDDVLRLNGGDATRATGQLPAEGQYSDPTSDPAHADLYNGYSAITNYDFDVEVGLNGKGLDHNYHVTEGMYYIEEDKDSVAKTIVGADGTTYRYLQTHIESEYTWRDDEYVAMRWGGAYNEPVHVSPNYTDLDPDAPAYRSIPEVLGNYKDKDGSWVQENGAPVRNTMLPFYIYNVYIPDVKLDVEKKWVNVDAPDDAEVTVELYYAKRKVRPRIVCCDHCPAAPQAHRGGN